MNLLLDTHIWLWSLTAPEKLSARVRRELASERSEDLLQKNDPRIGDGFGYVYFPMLSRSGQGLAFAASRGDHDHFRSDYEVFVVPTDPDTLELLGPAVRMSFHP